MTKEEVGNAIRSAGAAAPADAEGEGLVFSEEQIREHQKLVNSAELRIAVSGLAAYYARKTQKRIEQEDFLQAGMEGAAKAARRFQPGMGATFKTYAWTDIRGQMVRLIEKGTRAQRAADEGADKFLRGSEAMDDAHPEDSAEAHAARLREFSDGLLHHMTGAVVSEAYKTSALEGSDDLLGEQKLVALMKRGLEKLTELHRWLIDFVWFEEHTLKEAVGHPGLPNYIKVRRVYAEAMERLRTFLAQHGVFGLNGEGPEGPEEA